MTDSEQTITIARETQRDPERSRDIQSHTAGSHIGSVHIQVCLIPKPLFSHDTPNHLRLVIAKQKTRDGK